MTEKHDRSRAQESHVAATLFGGRVQPRSGAGWRRKNDVRTPKWLIECKRTDNKASITLKAADLEGVMRNALRDGGRSGALQFDLNGRGYYVVRAADFEGLTEDAD